VDDDEEDEDDELGNITVPPMPLTMGASMPTPMLLTAALLEMPTLLPLLLTDEMTPKLGLNYWSRRKVNKMSNINVINRQYKKGKDSIKDIKV